MSRPLIGVTGPARGGQSGWSMTWLALLRGGARVRRLRPPYREEQLASLQGIVIGGGAHIEPRRYYQQPAIEYVYDEQRDEFEWSVLQVVMQRGLPLLGICRGAQLLNVFCGGSLFQNLREDIPGLHLKRHVLARKRVEVQPTSLLARVMGVNQVRVNSLHMQGVRELGRGVRVSARDSFGLVQAIEASETSELGRFALGVQWHPEYLPARAPQRRLFDALVSAANGGGDRQR